MKLSTRSSYGLRLMLYLALNYGKGPTFLKKIAEKEDISERYLSHLVILLKNAGFINSFRGAHGGYILAKKPSELILKDIIEILEGDLSLVDCVKDPSCCNKVSVCVTREVWIKLKEEITDILNSFTLQDLVNMQKEKGDIPLMYNI
jgi:Rrf2 family protein